MKVQFGNPMQWPKLFLICCLLLAAIGNASAGGTPVTSLPWSPFLQPIVLGSGLQVTPNQIAVVNQSVTPTSYSWQNHSASITLLDYANQTQTIQNLGINAWAEYQGLTFSGSFSFDYSRFQAFKGNHRHWEVDARQDWTAFVPNPVLNSTAQQYQSNPTAFQGLFGDYAVTGITYRQEIKITFDAEFDSSLTSQQINAAIQASGGCWGAGASVTDAQNALSVFSQVTITATVTGVGQGTGTIIASGSTGDLGSIQSAVQQQLAQWGLPPSDPNNAGNVVSATVMPYTAIPPVVQITAQPSPDQVDLTAAIAEYVYLENAIARLTQIQIEDTNLNSKLYGYLFGYFNSRGTYVPGRLDVANADLALEYAYMQALANNTTATDPKIKFSFQDPDVVQWHVVQAVRSNTAHAFYVEVYSNAQVSPYIVGATDEWDDWTNRFIKHSGSNLYSTDQDIVESDSYTANLDPVTGIPHRCVLMRWNTPPPPSDATVALISDGGQQFYNATDWSGWPAPTLFVPNSQQIYQP